MKRFCILDGSVKSMEGSEGSHENDGNMIVAARVPGLSEYRIQ